MSEEDEQLPLARHVVGVFQILYLIEDMIVVMLMWPEKVIIGDPEGDIVVGTLIVVIAAGYAVGSLKRAVETLDHLFERAEPFGDFVLVCKPDDLGDAKAELLTELVEELLGRKGISTVSVSYTHLGYNPITPVLICNPDAYEAVRAVTGKEVLPGEDLIEAEEK